MLAFPLRSGIVVSMKRAGACSLQADEPRVPRASCSFSQVEKVKLRASHEKSEVSCNARPHPGPLLQERENHPPHSRNSKDWVYRTRIATTGVGRKPFLLLGEKVRLRVSQLRGNSSRTANPPKSPRPYPWKLELIAKYSNHAKTITLSCIWRGSRLRSISWYGRTGLRKSLISMIVSDISACL